MEDKITNSSVGSHASKESASLTSIYEDLDGISSWQTTQATAGGRNQALSTRPPATIDDDLFRSANCPGRNSGVCGLGRSQNQRSLQLGL
jgi:hypothetical protein